MLKKIVSSILLTLCVVLVGCTAVVPAPESTGVAWNELDKSAEESPLVVYRLKAMDPISVQIKGLPMGPDVIDDTVDEEGNINLPYVGQVKAAGRTTSELEKAIYKAYVQGEIYKSSISVTVNAYAKSFYVWGEVRLPGKYQLISGTTLLQAIASAGGYSPYANQKKIELIRAGKKLEFNGKELERSPEQDPKVEPDDVIRVMRSIL